MGSYFSRIWPLSKLWLDTGVNLSVPDLTREDLNHLLLCAIVDGDLTKVKELVTGNVAIDSTHRSTAGIMGNDAIVKALG